MLSFFLFLVKGIQIRTTMDNVVKSEIWVEFLKLFMFTFIYLPIKFRSILLTLRPIIILIEVSVLLLFFSILILFSITARTLFLLLLLLLLIRNQSKVINRIKHECFNLALGYTQRNNAD